VLSEIQGVHLLRATEGRSGRGLGGRGGQGFYVMEWKAMMLGVLNRKCDRTVSRQYELSIEGEVRQ
jgi:hypothetical protein